MDKSYRKIAKKAILFSVIGMLSTCPTLVFAKIPVDPYYNNQQSMWDQINAPSAWDRVTGSPAVTVAVIDTGIDISNDDLRGNIWHNNGEIPDNNVDDDNNGYIDDSDGWNFVENNNDVRPSVFNSTDDPEVVKHGTLVAGLIGAVGDNGIAGTGINWQVKIMALRAIANSGNGSSDNVAAAVEYAINKGADVINMSFVGDGEGTLLKQAFRRAYDKGIVVVAAGGNNRGEHHGDLDQFPQFPVCLDKGDADNWIVGVTSLNNRDRLSSFADYGSCVDISAPGENIYSTDRYAPQYGYPLNFSGPYQGTSFAAPLVSGAAALVKGIRPDWRAPQIIDLMLSSADSVDYLNPLFVGRMGRGKLNIGKIVASLPAPAGVVVAAPPKKYSEPGIVYVVGSDIRRFELLNGSSRVIESIADAVIQGITVANLNDDGDKQVVVLLKKTSGYFIKILKEDGTVLEERPVLREQMSKKTIASASGLRAIRLENNELKWVIEVIKTGKNSPRALLVLNGSFQAERELVFPAGIETWDVSEKNSSIVIGQIKKNSLTLIEVPLLKGERKIKTVSGVTALYDLRIGMVKTAFADEIEMLVERNKKSELVTVSMSNGIVKSVVLPRQKNKNWKLLLTDLDGNETEEIFPIQLRGGSFSVFNGQFNVIQTITIPALKNLVF